MRNQWLLKRTNPNLFVFEVDDGEQHWYSAESKDDALNQHFEPLRDPKTGNLDLESHGIYDEIEVCQMSNETVLPVTQEDGKTVIRKTAREWASEGKGLVACTVW